MFMPKSADRDPDATVRGLASILLPVWPTPPTLYRDHNLGAKMIALSLPITAIDA